MVGYIIVQSLLLFNESSKERLETIDQLASNLAQDSNWFGSGHRTFLYRRRRNDRRRHHNGC